MQRPRLGLTAIAAIFTLVSAFLIGAPNAAAADVEANGTTPEDSSQVNLDEIPESATETLSCYSSGHRFTKGSDHYVPSGYPGGSWLTTRGNCNDINVIINSSSVMIAEVCFNPSSGSPYCQNSSTTIQPGQWTVVATNVVRGTRYKLDFRTGYSTSGRIAT